MAKEQSTDLSKKLATPLAPFYRIRLKINVKNSSDLQDFLGLYESDEDSPNLKRIECIPMSRHEKVMFEWDLDYLTAKVPNYILAFGKIGGKNAVKFETPTLEELSADPTIVSTPLIFPLKANQIQYSEFWTSITWRDLFSDEFESSLPMDWNSQYRG